MSGHGRHVRVETADGSRVLCHARGKKGEAVVGDRVVWQRTGDEGLVVRVLPRRSLLFRQDEWKTKAFAANVDRLLVVVAAQPVFGESQLARALIAAAAAGIEARIALNKRDLPGFAEAEHRLAPYAAMGVRIEALALKREPVEARAALGAFFEGQATLVLGPSGAGKSTLVNLFVADARAQVGEISQSLQTGRHTTTATNWYWIDRAGGSALVDSPGFQEFGLRQIAADDLASLMPDIAAHADACRYYNCTHLHEPGCGVLAALGRGEIAASRHRIYGEVRAELSR